MTTYARIQDGIVAEIITLPATILQPDPAFAGEPDEDGTIPDAPLVAVPLTIEMAMHPDIAAHCVPCGGDVRQGWSYDAGKWSAPAPLPPAVEAPPRLTFNQFMDLFTDSEQTAIAGAAMADVATKIWYDRAVGANFIDMADPKTIAGLQKMVDAKLLTASRRDRVLKGIPA